MPTTLQDVITRPPQVGQIWRSVDPRREFYTFIVTGYSQVAGVNFVTGRGILDARGSFSDKPVIIQLDRFFHAYTRGYRLVSSMELEKVFRELD